jgi:hypothetical protein
MVGVSAELLSRGLRGRVNPASRVAWARAGSRLIALAFWVILPALCVLMLVLGTQKLSTHLNNMPAGTMGTYLVTSHNCNGEVCVTGGTFTSADGRLTEKNLLGVYSWQDGEVHKAIYDSTSVDVIPLPTHWDPTATITGMAGALGFVVLWSVFLYGAIRRRFEARTPQWDVSSLA